MDETRADPRDGSGSIHLASRDGQAFPWGYGFARRPDAGLPGGGGPCTRGRRCDRRLHSPLLLERFGAEYRQAREEIELVQGASAPLTSPHFWRASRHPSSLARRLTNFGVREILDALVELAPAPQPRTTLQRLCRPMSLSSAAWCSRSRPTWIQPIATASRFCASARGASSVACRSRCVGTTRKSGHAPWFLSVPAPGSPRGGLFRRHHRIPIMVSCSWRYPHRG